MIQPKNNETYPLTIIRNSWINSIGLEEKHEHRRIQTKNGALYDEGWDQRG